MIQCTAGHFYDPSKHTACPFCGVALDLGPPGATVPLRPEALAAKTMPLREPGDGTLPPPPALAGTAPLAPGVTRRLVREETGMDPVVGWLVCVEGPDRGRDWRLHAEKNFLGRDASMDVCIAGDETISRQKHATVAFEPKKKLFWLIPGDASGLVYLNGDVLYAPAALKARDIVELGKTKLTLVPFVDDTFAWT